METASNGEPGQTGDGLLDRARDALERHEWQAAFDLFAEAGETAPLGAQDLQGWAEAAWFLARPDTGIELLERAFKSALAAGERAYAAALAVQLSVHYTFKGGFALSEAWVGRAEEVLDGEPESFAHGYLALAHHSQARAFGDTETATALAEQALDIATRTKEPNLEAFARMAVGMLQVARGEVPEGFALMQRASISAISGELTPYVTGVVCCQMIQVCRDLTDVRRATEWTDAVESWCARESVSGFPGVCRIHRAELAAIHGSWDQAEADLARATEELVAYHGTPAIADGYYAMGEIRLYRGDLAGAEQALRQAHAVGRDPQPALALVRLAEGKVKAALSQVNAAVDEERENCWARFRLLPAQAQIAVAAGDLDVARSAAGGLDLLVTRYESPALRARRHEAWARIHLATGDPAAAAKEIRTAIARWNEVIAPYDVARDRVLLAQALHQLEDDDSARFELDAAAAEFRRLGAARDLAEAERAERAIAGEDAAAPARKTFVFTDIVGSTTLAEALGDEAWRHLLAWHDETLRGRITGHGGTVVNSTGDGFFAAFDDVPAALGAAVDIQRALAEHRRTTGFAPAVRIGLHAAEATLRGEDYSGVGVHVAARVAALGGAGEIVASAATLAGIDGIATADPRDERLKGVAEPVPVVTVHWE